VTRYVDFGNLQGNLLRSYPREFRCTRYIFLRPKRLTDGSLGAEARRAVAHWLGAVSFSQPQRRRRHGEASPERQTVDGGVADDCKVNLSFTFAGLKALGVLSDEMLDALPRSFKEGARERAGGLGDRWNLEQDTIPLHETHVMLMIHSRTPDAGAECWEQLARTPFEAFHILDAAFPEASLHRERFGFQDGRSQPAIEGVDEDAVGGGVYAQLCASGRRPWQSRLEDLGLRERPRGWRLIRTGEFLLGHENEDGAVPDGSMAPLGPDSTFMVYREIDQDVEGFLGYVAEWGRRTGLGAERLGAKIVGRWPDGIPIGQLHRDPRDVAQNQRRLNDFRYAEDPSGYGCPLGAHVRRANPRDALPGGGEQTMRHRIIRRGKPYEGVCDGYGSCRQGLAFVCFNASIDNGFEFIQREWINGGEQFGLGARRDFLLQQPDAHGACTEMVIEGFAPIVLPPPKRMFVTVRGCEYFFVPSRRACMWLAGVLSAAAAGRRS